MLRCDGCGCVSEDGRGWLSFVASDPEADDRPFAIVFCPPCGERECEAPPRVETYG